MLKKSIENPKRHSINLNILMKVYNYANFHTMSIENSSKINRLLTNWPHSSVFTCSYLKSQGFPYELIERYRKSGWLKSVGHGAVARVGDEINWTGGLYAIQTQLHL